MSIVKRLSQDLKKDPRKTMVMLILAVGFLGVCGYRTIEYFSKSSPKPVAVETESAPTESVSEPASPEDLNEEEPRFARFLSASLPYERIGGNPFRAFYLDREEAREEPEKILKEKREEDLAREEKSALSTIKVTCTVTGRNAFAVVDGNIMKLGEEYKGFIIEEVGEGYVLFVGQTTSRRIHVPF